MSDRPQTARSPFPPVFWLVIVFEFFERGSYYGMMSVLSVYFTDALHFSKESVGIIKSVIQPILYFLPIVAGALADRFGYRRALTLAFALLGVGYLLTSRFTTFTGVFLSLVVMALGAGTFKPIISGTIARTTDKTNSTLGFGVYYWSINLGAFLFPLVLVPYLKGIGWGFVILASAVGTGAMVLPTLLFFREPAAAEGTARRSTSLVQTLADAFEIIYSPFVLAFFALRRSGTGRVLVLGAAVALTGYGLVSYLKPQGTVLRLASVPVAVGGQTLVVEMARDQSAERPYALEPGDVPRLVVHQPERMLVAPAAAPALQELSALGIAVPDASGLKRILEAGDRKPSVRLIVRRERGATDVSLSRIGPLEFRADVRATAVDDALAARVTEALHAEPALRGAEPRLVRRALDTASRPRFLVLFVAILLWTGFAMLALAPRVRDLRGMSGAVAAAALGGGMVLLLALVPGLSLFARILCGVLYLTLLSLLLIRADEPARFRDHLRFLAMIGLYSGFWVLYFQMFDSVLWYVKAYVDATPIDNAVNGVLAFFGLGFRWRFDVEHVTVINAGTIILLQLIVSRLVEKTRALPTMIFGILLGTLGMAILAISTHIWVFLVGIVIFSIGEMTAHPKFISWVGQTAPRDRVATYMGYIFLYGVIGSSIGGVLGANLYVHFVDQLNRPRVLWLIFASIGAATIAGLLLYDRFVRRDREIPE